MLAGFDRANGDCVVIMDADLQHPPTTIPEMLKEWEAGYEDVYARRTDRGKEPWVRRKLTLLYYSIFQLLFKFPPISFRKGSVPRMGR